MDETMYNNNLHAGRNKRTKNVQKETRSPYDALRPWSAITHGAGAFFAVIGTVILLLKKSNTAWHYSTFSVYGAAMILLYTASALYHSVHTSVEGRIAFRKLDHACIYLLIAGTYTPICLIPMRNAIGWTLFVTIWVLAFIGLAATLIWINSPRWLTAGIYIFMGWLALVAIIPLIQVLSQGIFWLLLGGVLYTVGGILYAIKLPGRNNPHFGCHEIFHLFILAGSVCHYLLMYFFI